MFERKKEIIFDQVNIIDFLLIGFTLIKFKDILEDKFVSWIKDNLKEYLYKYLHNTTFIIILKYNIIKIGMSKRNMYQLTVVALIYSVLTFNLFENIKQLMKLLLVYRRRRKKFNLKDYKPYTSDRRDESILKLEKKSLIDITNLQLALSISTASTFY